MTQRWHDALGKVFAFELEAVLQHHNMPFQSKKAKVYKELEAAGLVEFVDEILPGRFRVTVSGWRLTGRGHYLYCMQCEARSCA